MRGAWPSGPARELAPARGVLRDARREPGEPRAPGRVQEQSPRLQLYRPAAAPARTAGSGYRRAAP